MKAATGRNPSISELEKAALSNNAKQVRRILKQHEKSVPGELDAYCRALEVGSCEASIAFIDIGIRKETYLDFNITSALEYSQMGVVRYILERFPKRDLKEFYPEVFYLPLKTQFEFLTIWAKEFKRELTDEQIERFVSNAWKKGSLNKMLGHLSKLYPENRKVAFLQHFRNGEHAALAEGIQEELAKKASLPESHDAKKQLTNEMWLAIFAGHNTERTTREESLEYLTTSLSDSDGSIVVKAKLCVLALKFGYKEMLKDVLTKSGVNIFNSLEKDDKFFQLLSNLEKEDEELASCMVKDTRFDKTRILAVARQKGWDTIADDMRRNSSEIVKAVDDGNVDAAKAYLKSKSCSLREVESLMRLAWVKGDIDLFTPFLDFCLAKGSSRFLDFFFNTRRGRNTVDGRLNIYYYPKEFNPLGFARMLDEAPEELVDLLESRAGSPLSRLYFAVYRGDKKKIRDILTTDGESISRQERLRLYSLVEVCGYHHTKDDSKRITLSELMEPRSQLQHEVALAIASSDRAQFDALMEQEALLTRANTAFVVKCIDPELIGRVVEEVQKQQREGRGEFALEIDVHALLDSLSNKMNRVFSKKYLDSTEKEGLLEAFSNLVDSGLAIEVTNIPNKYLLNELLGPTDNVCEREVMRRLLLSPNVTCPNQIDRRNLLSYEPIKLKEVLERGVGETKEDGSPIIGKLNSVMTMLERSDGALEALAWRILYTEMDFSIDKHTTERLRPNELAQLPRVLWSMARANEPFCVRALEFMCEPNKFLDSTKDIELYLIAKKTRGSRDPDSILTGLTYYLNPFGALGVFTSSYDYPPELLPEELTTYRPPEGSRQDELLAKLRRKHGNRFGHDKSIAGDRTGNYARLLATVSAPLHYGRSTCSLHTHFISVREEMRDKIREAAVSDDAESLRRLLRSPMAVHFTNMDAKKAAVAACAWNSVRVFLEVQPNDISNDKCFGVDLQKALAEAGQLSSAKATESEEQATKDEEAEVRKEAFFQGASPQERTSLCPALEDPYPHLSALLGGASFVMPEQQASAVTEKHLMDEPIPDVMKEARFKPLTPMQKDQDQSDTKEKAGKEIDEGLAPDAEAGNAAQVEALQTLAEQGAAAFVHLEQAEADDGWTAWIGGGGNSELQKASAGTEATGVKPQDAVDAEWRRKLRTQQKRTAQEERAHVMAA